MSFGCHSILGAIGPDYTLQWVLFAGLSIWTVLLMILMWTRWGQARPLVKCIALSFFAHMLLFLFMWGTRVLNSLPPGESLTGTTHVRLIDEPGNSDHFAGPDGSEGVLPGDSVEKPITAPDLLPAPPPEETKPAVEAVAQNEPLAPAPMPEQGAAPVEPPLPMDPSMEATPPENQLRQSPDQLAGNQLREQPLPGAGTNETAANTPRFLEDPLNPARQHMPVSQPAAIPRRAADGEAIAPQLQLRMRSDRFERARQFGATPDTERSVQLALKWLVANQNADGRWIAAAHGAGKETRALGQDRQGAGQKADMGITGLALLAFLASGQTHLEGEHRETIQHGLEFLLANQAEDGNLSGEAELFARMYCHGICSLALSEAYALTGDRRLHEPARRAVQYTISAQHVGGGWRYQPHDAGDLSQFGWQLMSLKSAEMAGMRVPDETRVRMIRFLRSVTGGRYKGLASYRPGEQVTRPMTAEALACRYFLDAENSPETIEEAATFISQELPRGDRVNLYYWYYGTLGLFQKHDADWVRWNNAMQAALLPKQRGDDQYLGSWDPDQVWGGYGGRVYSTSLACLCLEAYYRYLPVYADPVGSDRWTEVPGQPARPR
ncbi:hypothetical protein [Anatilimnocola floriformis]|uniref:hypothetical protein n=1 Tax=Anatilimnocola floriformis TaxID=2948575 RepID=UPI0020C24BF4|nr:hypothetical protein [Anatilimnocola floriformis]